MTCSITISIFNLLNQILSVLCAFMLFVLTVCKLLSKRFGWAKSASTSKP